MDTSKLMLALSFASEKHKKQHRKGKECIPYINHPIQVAQLLVDHQETKVECLMAAILHDTLEDTATTEEELREQFGDEVCSLVLELSDDKYLSKEERKQKQIEYAPKASRGAKAIKLADKIANIRDIAISPPKGWSIERKIQYLDWSDAVVAGLRGVNADLEATYDREMSISRQCLLC